MIGESQLHNVDTANIFYSQGAAGTPGLDVSLFIYSILSEGKEKKKLLEFFK